MDPPVSTVSGNPFTGFAEPGSFSASAGYEFITDPDISDRTKWIVAGTGVSLMTLGTALNMAPLAAVPLGFGLEAQGVADGMPLRVPLFKNRYPLGPIDFPRMVPTSQLSRISGNFNYVITQDGRLIVGRSAHTSLTVGANVRAAGEVQLFNGNIKWIDNASGHYRPTGPGLSTLVEDAFNAIGLDATGKFILRTF